MENKSKTSLTLEDIENKIYKEHYRTIGDKTIVCCLVLQNEFEVIGTSSCVDRNNYDFEIGKKIARENALNKVWEVEGYLLQESLYNKRIKSRRLNCYINLNFEEILPELRNGKQFARHGWNGKGMYIKIQDPDEHSKMSVPYIYIKTADGEFAPWIPSHTDLFCDDWKLVPSCDTIELIEPTTSIDVPG